MDLLYLWRRGFVLLGNEVLICIYGHSQFNPASKKDAFSLSRETGVNLVIVWKENEMLDETARGLFVYLPFLFFILDGV